MTIEQYDEMEAARLKMSCEALAVAMLANTLLESNFPAEMTVSILRNRIGEFRNAHVAYNTVLDVGVGEWKKENIERIKNAK